jgi:hypothetical protein
MAYDVAICISRRDFLRLSSNDEEAFGLLVPSAGPLVSMTTSPDAGATGSDWPVSSNSSRRAATNLGLAENLSAISQPTLVTKRRYEWAELAVDVDA